MGALLPGRLCRILSLTPVSEREMQQLERSLGKLEGKMELLLDQSHQTLEYLTSMDARVRRLEAWKARAIGLCAGGAAVGAALIEVAWRIAPWIR